MLCFVVSTQRRGVCDMSFSFLAKFCAVVTLVVLCYLTLSQNSEGSYILYAGIMVAYFVITLFLGTWYTGEKWKKMGEGRRLLIYFGMAPVIVTVLNAVFFLIAGIIALVILLPLVTLGIWGSLTRKTRIYDYHEGGILSGPKWVERGSQGKVYEMHKDIWGQQHIHERNKNILDEL